MRRFTALAAALSLALAGAAAPAAAKDKHKVKAEYKERGGSKVKVKYQGGGPPPWAPAHGYRSHGGGGEVRTGAAYVAPFQLDAGRCNRGALGAVLGGAAGGVLGAQVGGGKGRDVATIAGAILGVIVGQSIGRWMDDVDQACVGQVLEHAPTGRPVEWVNPDNGVVYQVTPTETYRAPDDRYCREYQTQAQIGGRTERLYGTACRQPDGSWERVSR